MAKPKKCRVCRDEFKPFRTTATVCSLECSLTQLRAKADKDYRSETKRRREALRTQSEWIAFTQVAFNKYIRARDGNHCISCGKTTGQFHAGHYRPTSTQSALRFNEVNVHSQCAACNSHLSGNLTAYRTNLITKIGPELVDWLDRDHKGERMTIDELKWLRSYYSRRAREAIKAQEAME
jgi:hypothetical protein